MSEWKEYINVEVLTLIVAFATFIVSVLSYRYMRTSDKRKVRSLINNKTEQLKSLEDSTRFGVSHTEAGSLRAQQAMLRAEIEQLKQQLKEL